MALETNPEDPLGIPRPPVLRPTWTTYVYIGLAIAVAIATVVGFWFAAQPYMF